ncbi:hypothetical protein [Streptomyces sp. NK08204]|uniref:hypothetical protein n=1 Tax=Streptomyces sp. NK08204 TaxID=2873260 RepID=UPI001CED8C4A|nr:hypothetical protein [Streptomyces sp. NK08204]
MNAQADSAGSTRLSGTAAEDCSHERSNLSDSASYGHRYSTTAGHRISCDHCRYQRRPDVEAAPALSQADLERLKADPDRVRDNTRVVADQIATEKLILAIGTHLGKQSAHEYVYAMAQSAGESGQSLRDPVIRDGYAGASLDTAELDRIFDPAHYLGQPQVLVALAAKRARAWLPATEEE